jgi:hypothetical protein
VIYHIELIFVRRHADSFRTLLIQEIKCERRLVDFASILDAAACQ